ncbi:putative methylmalonate-semialdehyde like protein [Argiope bruennichi]|uniref:Putative methylmalonate-semialdehyde like protein n=1 Tax=Argiope bruennichi TaxID=94029 RepID=A0A8T0FCN4_ARGBR|nr:putative methylmalonate-semialdehyde like protein [Argiope bruennichi]
MLFMVHMKGKYVYERGSKNVKRVQCNMLVGAAGQHCMALSTAVFVGESPNGFQILQKVESEIKEGAKLLLDGRGIVVPGFEKGNFVGPTILFDVKGVNFCTQLKTITQLWREQDATDSKAATSMPVMK